MNNSRRWAGALVVFAQAACSSTHGPSLSPTTCTSSGYKLDIDSASRAIRHSYAYLANKAVNWRQMERLAQQAADTVHSKHELVGALERLLDNLYDAHAIVRANTNRVAARAVVRTPFRSLCS